MAIKRRDLLIGTAAVAATAATYYLATSGDTLKKLTGTEQPLSTAELHASFTPESLYGTWKEIPTKSARFAPSTITLEYQATTLSKRPRYTTTTQDETHGNIFKIKFGERTSLGTKTAMLVGPDMLFLDQYLFRREEAKEIPQNSLSAIAGQWELGKTFSRKNEYFDGMEIKNKSIVILGHTKNNRPAKREYEVASISNIEDICIPRIKTIPRPFSMMPTRKIDSDTIAIYLQGWFGEFKRKS